MSALKLASLITEFGEDGGPEKVVVTLDDGEAVHDMTFTGYPAMSLHLSADGGLVLNFVVRASPLPAPSGSHPDEGAKLRSLTTPG